MPQKHKKHKKHIVYQGCDFISDRDFMGVITAARESGRALIAGHRNPDGDTIGACFAMALALADMGVKPVVLLEPFSERFSYLTGREYLFTGCLDELDPGIIICLDCATKDRLGKTSTLLDRCPLTINIDHHVQGNDGFFAQINIVETNVSSTSELLYTLLKGARVNITSDIAAALYTGMITDSGCFRHNSTTPKTLEIAAHLMDTGIDFNLIQRRAIYEHSPIEAAAFAAAIGGMRIFPDIKLAITSLTNEIMKSIGAVGTDMDGIAEYMLNTEGIEVSALLTEREPGVTHISFRSIDINVRDIAGKFGGGGHIHAAGGMRRGPISETAELVIKALGDSYGT